MKKFFTLMAAALLSSGAFAQSEWQNMVENGDMEGAEDPEWSCFWVHEWRTPEEQFQGFAYIVEDPTDPTNHCAKLIARSEAEADEAGNKILDINGNFASWDSQFFVYVRDAIPEGKELRLTMRVRAEKAAEGETQAHDAPGDYNHWQLFGNMNFTTDWKKIQLTATITSDMTQQDAGKEMHSVAINLAKVAEGNVYYFDDVKLEMRDPKGPEQFEEWFNFLRHGTLSEDKIHNTNFTTFTGRDGADGIDRKARVVIDADGEPALNVTSIGWNAVKRTPILDEEGNPVLDENGDPTYEETDCYVKYGEEKNDTLTSIDNWQSQFFVSCNHKFAPNQQYKLVMWARADKDATIETQAHTTPGSYIYWDMVGQLNLTPEWQKFEFGVDGDRTITTDQKGMQTIAFNCNVLKEENNYYFRFEDFSANSAEVTLDERTLDSEEIMLPIPEPDKEDGIVAYVDMTPCVNMLEVEDYQNLLEDDHLMVQQSEDDYSAKLSSTTGFFLNEQGLFDESGKFIVEINSEGTADKTEFTIYNTGDSFAGKTMDTRLVYLWNNWNYVYNVHFVPEEAYMGITEVSTQPKTGIIYDLSGRRVTKAGKGLYIIDGKKYIGSSMK